MSEICLCDNLISLKSKQKFQLSFLFVYCYGVDKCDSEDESTYPKSFDLTHEGSSSTTNLYLYIYTYLKVEA